MLISDLNKVSGLIKNIGNDRDIDILLSTDSRMPEDKNTFIALKGERFDAYNFIEDAIKNGAKAIVLTHSKEREEEIKELYEKYKEICFFLVEDSLSFLQEAAKFRIVEWKNHGGFVFGLTGSNGKTTTKELLYSLAKSFLHDAVICTQGNLNNHIGVPLTIFSIKDEHKFAIVEMGTNHFGEIEVLCKIAQPDYGYITNIGHAHTEFLIDLNGVLTEKSALYRWINDHGKKFFLNLEDEKLATLDVTEKVVPVSKDNVYEFESEFIKESYNRWNVQSSCFVLENIFSLSLFHELKKLRLPENKRAQWINVDHSKIYLDAYNANPTSMRLAIREFAKQVPDTKNVIFIIGDMNELGDKTQEHHESIAELLNDLGIKNSIFIGRFANFYQNKFGGASETYINLEDFISNWPTVLNSYDYIFLKASRSLQLERLIDITM
ncbi:Mur ligase central domain protein [Bacteriovorax sp. BAL6_X]|uniref:UDP-N-acetylmuramoyl-tripeptide--D-alanyl-D- alanine ligase n=1 Tax=Bacteriovorax sp. BAL6_X TaxID=1201290 RepID=UPI000385F715|nr:UDP-N-acetylmuramoyl-tripeptide--D-alanyl-D-alanine ligase [Bacteriovorax sp. BAL6_X]EPZ50258.1 Mur ligase central domain protein [Bacteriovorax sp. BAL6_X]